MPCSPLTPEDLYRFRWVDHPRLNPDATRLAWHVGWADAERRENLGAIWVAAGNGSESRQLTDGTRRDRSPEWSPDGHLLAFLGKRGPSDQLLVISPDGGEARQLTQVSDGVGAFAWAPDGRSLACVARVPADFDGVVDDPRPSDNPDQGRRPPVARVARTLSYKYDGRGYFDGRREHLFVVPLAGGEPRQITDGPWSVQDFDWSPDGRRLVIAGDADPDADLRLTRKLYLVDVDGGPPRPLVRDMAVSSPAWSPRGDLIAFLAPTEVRAGFFDRIWVVAEGGGEPRCLTLDFDQSVGAMPVSDMRAGHGTRLVWDPSGERILFQASTPGAAELYSVDLEGQVRRELSCERRTLTAFDARDGAVAACLSDPASPGDLFRVEGGQERRLTDANPWLRERWLAEPERHEFTAADGWPIEGWLLKPQDFNPAARHPLVLEIHGGPHGQYGWAFFHELQVLAGMGHLVLYCNPRGSDGYGETFRRACERDWGGKDYLDLMSSLDQLIDRAGFVDVARLGIAGGSYGGYMTNWAIGQTDRFAAAVSMRSICNLVSDYAQTDIVPWGELEYGPPPWPDPSDLWQHSPIRCVRNITTPLLLLHGEMDLRCPISQAEELFGALRLLRREVELVRFPGESHDLSRGGRPDRRVERLRRIAGWFEKHLLQPR